MKRTVQDQELERRLCEGEWTLNGCLGDDPLGIDRIEVDRGKLQALGLDLAGLGRRLEELWRRGAERLGAPTGVAPEVSLTVEEAKGRIACPFDHPGTYPKGVMIVTTPSGKMRFSPLSIHMLGAHGFLGGLGSRYRVEPDELAGLAALLDRQQENQDPQE